MTIAVNLPLSAYAAVREVIASITGKRATVEIDSSEPGKLR